MSPIDPQLDAAFVSCRGELTGFVKVHAGLVVLRYEAPEDLVQGIFSLAVQSAANFEARDEDSARMFLFRIARRYLVDRYKHWSAAKRNSGKMLRLTGTGTGSRRGAGEPSTSRTGPVTFANRREQLAIATRALALLMPKDRDIMNWSSLDVPIVEQATRLGLSYTAMAKSRLRALARFRKTFELVARRQERRGREARGAR